MLDVPLSVHEDTFKVVNLHWILRFFYVPQLAGQSLQVPDRAHGSTLYGAFLFVDSGTYSFIPFAKALSSQHRRTSSLTILPNKKKISKVMRMLLARSLWNMEVDSATFAPRVEQSI